MRINTFKHLHCFAMSGCLMLANLFSPSTISQEINASNLIEPFLDSETVVVAYSEIQSLDHAEFETRLARRLPWIVEIESQMAKLKKGAIANVAIAFGPTGLLGDTHKIAGVYFCKDVAVALTAIRSIPGFENAVTENDRGAILFGATKEALDWLKNKNGNPLPALVLAKKAWRGNHGVAVALPEGFVSNVVSTLTTASDTIEFLNDLRWISASGDVVAGKQSIVAEFGSSVAADEVMNRLSNLPSFKQEKSAEIEQKDSLLTARYSFDSGLLREILGAANATSIVSVPQKQMKQIVLAMHNFHEAHSCFPPQTLVDKAGKPLFSWRVLLLPYLDQKELYAKFHLDEPWDSPNNLALVKQMPEVYASPFFRNALVGRTRYLAPLTSNSAMGTPGAPSAVRKITDGTVNTIWMVEVPEEQAVVWTRPADIVIDQKDPLRGIVSAGSDRFLASLLDGSVCEISSNIKAETAIALFSINGGEVINVKDFGPH